MIISTVQSDWVKRKLCSIKKEYYQLDSVTLSEPYIIAPDLEGNSGIFYQWDGHDRHGVRTGGRGHHRERGFMEGQFYSGGINIGVIG